MIQNIEKNKSILTRSCSSLCSERDRTKFKIAKYETKKNYITYNTLFLAILRILCKLRLIHIKYIMRIPGRISEDRVNDRWNLHHQANFNYLLRIWNSNFFALTYFKSVIIKTQCSVLVERRQTTSTYSEEIRQRPAIHGTFQFGIGNQLSKIVE